MRKEIIICDLCGQPITSLNDEEEYKFKKRWSLWHEHGWERIDLHQSCREKLFKAIEEQAN